MQGFTYKVALTAVLWISVILITANAEGVFQLKLERFINDEGLDATGQCCSSSNREGNICTKPCLTAFRVCLTHFQANVNPDLPCTYGSIETPVIGENSFLPMEKRFFENSPIQFKIEARWLGSFSLIVDVVHKNANFSNQPAYDAGPSEDLISRLIVKKSGFQLPVKDKLELWTTPEPYQHRNSELHYSYRVLCLKNSYGPGCAIYCHPQNDSLGHFSCDENGQKECLPGWFSDNQDPYCTKATCQDGCFHGTCNQPKVCKCHPGWTGKDCSQCVTQPGCERGTCTLPYQCKCAAGWGGPLCNQDLNYCTNNHPCQNGGSCSNTGQGAYTCSCARGFTGRDCQVEIDECSNQPCQNDATCVDLKGDYHCLCSANFFGRNCDETRMKCSNSPCQHGVCIEGVKHYRCECPVEWTGVNCETPTNYCSASLCQNHGTCISTSNGFKCSCNNGFSGKFCENNVNRCQNSACLNGGVCMDSPTSSRTCRCRRCRCLSQFTGSRCQYNLTTTTQPKSSHVNVQLDVSYSEKFESDISYSKTKTETKMVVSNDKVTSLDATHWIAICFGSVILVLLLALSAGCLIYHRKKLSLAKLQLKLAQSAANQPRSNEMDLPVVVSSSMEDTLQIGEKRFQNNIKSEVRSTAVDFDMQRSCKTIAKLNEKRQSNHFEMQPCVKNGLATSNRIARRHSSQFTRPNAVFEFTNEAKEVTPLTKQNYGLSSQQMTSEDQETICSEGSRFLDHKRVEDRHSLTRLPTYEEVCEENDALLKQSPMSPKGIVI